MTTDWQTIRALFEKAVELPPGERVAFLDRTCGDDLNLRDRVERMLAADDNPETFLDDPVFGPAGVGRKSGNETPEATDPRLGTVLGSYRLEEVIGTGGMGAVYIARRVDGDFDRRVALKLVRQVSASADVSERFRRERRILALLVHPNIARLYDGGLAPDGSPYLVMEYVDGQPLHTYCREQGASVEERLRLFLDIGSAVSDAHRNLVVHRDLKPSNILVTRDGVVKLLDFGIAKLLDIDETDDTPLTRTGVRILTPEYAAPEQIRGTAITTATDVYALGVVLYELLVGRRPYQVAGLSPTEVERIVCDTEPRKPSVALAEGTLESAERSAEPTTRRLRGDLDNIVMKALRKEPDRRYASVEAMADDIRWHLADEPVSARPATAGYRLRKFATRHRAGVIASTVVLFLTIALVGFYTTRLARERDRAEQRFDDVRALANTMLFDLHDEIEYLPGSTQARRMLVSNALNYLDGLSEEASDASLLLELAEAYERVGEIQGHPNRPNLGDVSAAETSYRKALRIRRTLFETDSTNQALREALGVSHVRLGAVLAWSGRNEEAILQYRWALDMLGGTRADSASAVVVHTARPSLEIARAHVGLGDRLWWAGQADAALDHLRTGRSTLENLAVAHPEDREIQRELAHAYLVEGNVIAWENDSYAALPMFDEALDIFRGLRKEEPRHPRTRRGLWLTYLRIGENLPYAGGAKEALPALDSALVIVRRLAAEDSANATALRDVSLVHGYMGDVLANHLDRPGDALPHLRRALEIASNLRERDPENLAARRDVGAAHKRMGEALFAAGRHLDALTQFDRARSIWERLIAEDTDNTGVRSNLAATMAQIARAHGDMDDPDAAALWFDRSISLFEELESAGQLSGWWASVLDQVRVERSTLGE